MPEADARRGDGLCQGQHGSASQETPLGQSWPPGPGVPVRIRGRRPQGNRQPRSGVAGGRRVEMANLNDIIGYICLRHPRRRALTLWRLEYLVYLCDWRHTLQTGQPLTSIQWVLTSGGPYSDAIDNAVRRSAGPFAMQTVRPLLGMSRNVVVVADKAFRPQLNAEERKTVDHVLKVAGRLGDNELTQLVMFTYPALQPKYTPLDLPALARRYKEECRTKVGPLQDGKTSSLEADF